MVGMCLKYCANYADTNMLSANIAYSYLKSKYLNLEQKGQRRIRN